MTKPGTFAVGVMAAFAWAPPVVMASEEPRTIRHSPFALHAAYGAYQQARETGARTLRVITRWQDGEPRKGVYQSRRFDAAVRQIQALGLELVVTLRPVSRWGVGAASGRATAAETVSPASGYPRDMEAWLRYVSLVVERYDADGLQDMPGLRAPITYWQVDNEWIWQWQGTGEDYLRFLIQTSQAIKRANPGAQVILGALTGTEEAAVVEGISREDYVEFGDTDATRRPMSREEILASVRYRAGVGKVTPVLERGHPYFDIVDFHSYTTSPGDIADSVALLKTWMHRYGYDKPLWSLENAGPFFQFTREKYAEEVVKRHLIALHSGVERLFWSSLKPTVGWSENYLRLALIDMEGRKTPAYYTYRLMTEKLDGVRAIERLPAAEPGAAYKLSRPGGDVYVVWSDRGETDLTLPMSAGAAVITRLITAPGQTDPDIERRPVAEGTLTVRVSAPLFVEPASGPPRLDFKGGVD